ncbi:MAG: threonine-phosphate decarboxylase CobD [bacterium]|nr:threonine-phosphate decarboxylase CobD [bacterium]
MALIHGGDIQGFIDEYGYAPLDFSSNISPLGLPATVSEAIAKSIAGVERYPDPLCRRLVGAIAAHDGVEANQVLCGNGSADIIFRLALALRPSRALLPAPTFAEYEEALGVVGCEVLHHQLDPAVGFQLDLGFIERIDSSVDAVFVCQPNNPTGTVTPRDLLLEIAARCAQVGARLIVDECFVGFLEGADALTLVPELPGHPELIILKAFTKVYAMPGLRLGYMLSADGELIEAVRRVGQPWSVSSVAQEAGIAALEVAGYEARGVEMVARERVFLREGLASLGIEALGEANFLFFKLDDGGALTGVMRERGILIRDCSNYAGLDAGFYRIAVRTHEENERFLATLESCLA